MYVSIHKPVYAGEMSTYDTTVVLEVRGEEDISFDDLDFRSSIFNLMASLRLFPRHFVIFLYCTLYSPLGTSFFECFHVEGEKSPAKC